VPLQGVTVFLGDACHLTFTKLNAPPLLSKTGWCWVISSASPQEYLASLQTEIHSSVMPSQSPYASTKKNASLVQRLTLLALWEVEYSTIYMMDHSRRATRRSRLSIGRMAIQNLGNGLIGSISRLCILVADLG
jgi:hypothetical protein